MMTIWQDILIASLLVLGAAFALVGSYGLAKLSSFMKRLHGPTKGSTLGVGCILLASMAYFSFAKSGLNLHELLVTLFVFLSAPITAHLLAKAALKQRAAIRPPPPASMPASTPASTPAPVELAKAPPPG